MAFDESLANRIATIFESKGVAFTTKKMMGGLCFMVDDKMCVGVDSNRLMVRLVPDYYATALTLQGCQPMDFTGRPLKGFVFVDPSGTKTIRQLTFWLDKAIAFNPQAKSSKARKRKTKP